MKDIFHLPHIILLKSLKSTVGICSAIIYLGYMSMFTLVSKTINDLLADWCIQLDTNVVVVVTDNGSNIKKSLR